MGDIRLSKAITRPSMPAAKRAAAGVTVRPIHQRTGADADNRASESNGDPAGDSDAEVSDSATGTRLEPS